MRLLRGIVAGLVLSLGFVAARADETPPAAPPPTDWSAVPAVGLRKAIADGLVDASGSEPQSYTALKIRLKNRTTSAVAVDLGGAYFEARGRNCQRLAVGPPVIASATARRGAGSSVVLLEAGRETEFVVNTCCMDAGLPAPTTQKFEPASAEMPPVRERVMRWWIDNPTAPQGAVNAAIWQNAPDVRVGSGGVTNCGAPTGRSVALHGGAYYRLVDGELTCLDEQGILRLLGTEIFQVLPTDGAVYAVMLASDGTPKLWRLAVTGDSRWTRVMDLDGTDRIRSLHEGGRGNLTLVTDRGVVFHDAAKDVTTRVLNDGTCLDPSGCQDGEGNLLVAFRRPPRAPTYQGGQLVYEQTTVFGLWTVALGTGRSEEVRRFWNVDAVRAGPGGVFALTPTERHLRRLAGEKFVDLGAPGTAYRRIVGVAKDVVWLEDDDGKLLAADAKSGRVRLRTEHAADDVKVFALDARTGDLAYVAGTAFRWLHVADGREESVVPRN